MAASRGNLAPWSEASSSCSAWPSTYSMTMYGVCVDSSSPTSKMVTIPGWERRPAARASRKNRCRYSSMALASAPRIAMVLMATVRSIRGSRARKTAPMAPRPSSARISYRPSCCIVPRRTYTRAHDERPKTNDLGRNWADDSTDEQTSNHTVNLQSMKFGAQAPSPAFPRGHLHPTAAKRASGTTRLRSTTLELKNEHPKQSFATSERQSRFIGHSRWVRVSQVPGQTQNVVHAGEDGQRNRHVKPELPALGDPDVAADLM